MQEINSSKEKKAKETVKHAWKCSTASVDGIDEILQVNSSVCVCVCSCTYTNTKEMVRFEGFVSLLVECGGARARSLIVATFHYATVFLE